MELLTWDYINETLARLHDLGWPDNAQCMLGALAEVGIISDEGVSVPRAKDL